MCEKVQCALSVESRETRKVEAEVKAERVNVVNSQ